MIKKCMVLLIMACLIMTVFSISHDLETKFTISSEVISTSVSPIVAEKTEMLTVVVRVDHEVGSGSGVIIYRKYVVRDNTYVYYVITNAHVTSDRLIRELKIDGIRGCHRVIITDPGVIIRVFSDNVTEWVEYDAKVVVESSIDDLALIKFSTDDYLSDVVELADTEVMSSIEIFDPVYAVGCQLGELLIPTEGIVSGFVQQDNLMLIIHTAHILPGSSGGGLFKLYNGRYRLIGLPFAIRWYNFQIMPHYSYAISIEMIYRFLNDNDMSFIYENGMINEVNHPG